MCLGIPGRIVKIDDARKKLATADIGGVRRQVNIVTLEIGALAGVMADAIAFCFENVAKDSALEGAKLQINEIPGRARCNICGAAFAAASLFTPCVCGARHLTWLAGQELNIKSMETL